MAIAGLRQIIAHMLHLLLIILNKRLTFNHIQRMVKATGKLKHIHTLININRHRHRHDHTSCSKPGHLVDLAVRVAITSAVH
jgi:hypothetical protein